MTKPMNTSTDLVIPETNHCQEFRASVCGDKSDLVYMAQGVRDICIDAGTVRALRDWLNQAFPAEPTAQRHVDEIVPASALPAEMIEAARRVFEPSAPRFLGLEAIERHIDEVEEDAALKGAAESIKELIESQHDLPADAKAILYGNLDRLYLR